MDREWLIYISSSEKVRMQISDFQFILKEKLSKGLVNDNKQKYMNINNETGQYKKTNIDKKIEKKKQ
jgi:hypothetical protein